MSVVAYLDTQARAARNYVKTKVFVLLILLVFEERQKGIGYLYQAIQTGLVIGRRALLLDQPDRIALMFVGAVLLQTRTRGRTG